MRKRTLLRAACQTLAAFALLSSPLHSTAQAPTTPAYDVELVIFRNAGGGGSPELGAVTNNAKSAEEDGESADPSAPEASFPKLPPERYKLSSIYEALKRKGGYQPLAHIGWTQPATGRDTTRFVSLSALGLDSGVSGRAALARGRYLHLTLDLSYQPAGDSTRYVLQQTRRMRSTEIHYLDHPKFGVIALITPAPLASSG